jgi:hypothetical protein
MERTFSTEYRGAIDSFNFDLDEMQFLKTPIIKSFEKEIKRLRAEIERIENDENNEGQATYLVEIDRLTGMIKNYLNNIDELNKISRRN